MKRMLIDAAHPEETRVVVLDGARVDDFDFETLSRKPIRGNIYLARVTRVEPSLQAAFVEYGGNRHGFLAFNEIHPDYYQIPREDRQKLMDAERAEAEAVRRAEAAADEKAPASDGEDEIMSAGGGDDDDDAGSTAARLHRAAMKRYKIQEVVKRRQILLVQVVKEERGNKGAALTTYLSLAGRYCVLMPNTPRGGGISRKITSGADRKRLRKVVEELNVPDGVGLIVRTAGAKRTKAEIRRDYDYLIRLWETIRERTLRSVAPSLIYEESDLVKRAIRDLYDKDVAEVWVEGEEAYREAKDFIRMLMPSHAKKVQPYRDTAPLFLRHRVEDQLEQIYNPIVQLKSGGYIVINQTEALVAIDVNSGRATKERNIEATALKTNLEAADEAARQFRLRDLAGLIVIDFIDMDEGKNNRAVEKRVRDALKTDRARIQAGKISGFGLMELSRQRRRTSLYEGSHVECETCKGRGVIRSVSSSALQVLRRIEEEALRGRATVLRVSMASSVALYLLNDKRGALQAMEARFGVRVLITADDALVPPDCTIERVELRRDVNGSVIETDAPLPPITHVIEASEDDDVVDETVDLDETLDDDDDGDNDDAQDGGASARESGRDSGRDPGRESGRDGEGGAGAARSGRRRRRRGRGRGAEAAPSAQTLEPMARTAENVSAFEDEGDDVDQTRDAAVPVGDDDGDGSARRRRRRGRRGGRGRRPRDGADVLAVIDLDAPTDAETPRFGELLGGVEANDDQRIAADPVHTPAEAIAFDAPTAGAPSSIERSDVEPDAQPVAVEAAPVAAKPTRSRSRRKPAAEVAAQAEAASLVTPTPEAEPEALATPVAKEPMVSVPNVPAVEPVSVDVLAMAEAEAPAAAPPAPPAAEPEAQPDPDAEARRQRWQARLKSWLGG